ncbi:SGNH hydrolase-type esterase domain-containing protein [Lophiotrema nucula]|uniref:SGNH hydrolase-type esterase domain-containing protein n=1 Tax=Lophiotrema nucula TaxID=690887 RepID=A0A6A5ZBV8_9PLEO|nr:SGNH hydrolase-type esterase domain-containing protein [Lophiotrema nucula]
MFPRLGLVSLVYLWLGCNTSPAPSYSSKRLGDNQHKSDASEHSYPETKDAVLLRRAEGDPDPKEWDSELYSQWWTLPEDADMNISDTIRPFINKPYPNVEQWKAVGDSFSAGPGAGQDWDQEDKCDCMRHHGAYAPQLWQDEHFFFPDPDRPNEPPQRTTFDFLSCTGAVAPDMFNPTHCNKQVSRVGEFDDIVALSIGGNDFEFVKILQACVYKFFKNDDACDKQTDATKKLLYGDQFRTDYKTVIQGRPTTAPGQPVLDGLYQRMHWRNRNPQFTGVYQTGYLQFFDTYTDQCDDVSFIPWLPNGPPMKKELRRMLNNLVHQSNYVLEYYGLWNNMLLAGNAPPGQRPSRVAPYVNFVDVDVTYNSHRFCTEGVNEPARRNKDIWFFHFLNGWVKEDGNSTKRQDSPQGGGDQNLTATVPEWLAQTFHPKSAGFRASKDLLYMKMKFELFARKLVGKEKSIWIVGDAQCYHSSRVGSPYANGFKEEIQHIFNDPKFYGYRDNIPGRYGGLTPRFVGSQGWSGGRHDCYKGLQIDEIADEIWDSPIHTQFQKKVVVLALGTMDVFYGVDLPNAHRRVGRMLHRIFERDEDAVVFIHHLPMFGKDERGESFHNQEGLQRVVEFNARLSGLANYWRTRYGKRVLKVSLPVTTWDKRDLFYLDDRGYKGVAWALAEQFAMAASMDWITNDRPWEPDGPQGPAIPGPPGDQQVQKRQEEPDASSSGTHSPPAPVSTAIATSPGPKLRRDIEPSEDDPFPVPDIYRLDPNPDKSGTFICTQKRPDDAPSGEEILEAVYQGMSQDDWINKIGCNTTEICRRSIMNTPSEAYWDPGVPPNGTMCIGQGGGDGWDDATQIMITRPAGDMDIANGDNCILGLPSLLDKCIRKEGFYGGYFFTPADDDKDKLMFNITNLNFPISPVGKPTRYKEPIDLAWAERVLFDGEKLGPQDNYHSEKLPDLDPADEWC